MPAIVTNLEVEQCLRGILVNEGFSINPPRSHGQTGVDILAVKDGTSFHIECIAYKSSPPARAKDFYESFFRCVSRLNDGAKHCVIALSIRAEKGLPARAKHHHVAWLRIAQAFPELSIWFVDTDLASYRQTSWKEWVDRE
jgi:hypothetical protein